MGKLCGAAVKTRGSMGKKRYNARDRAGYSATLDAAGMAALNPRASGNGALLLDVSRRDGAFAYRGTSGDPTGTLGRSRSIFF